MGVLREDIPAAIPQLLRRTPKSISLIYTAPPQLLGEELRCKGRLLHAALTSFTADDARGRPWRTRPLSNSLVDGLPLRIRVLLLELRAANSHRAKRAWLWSIHSKEPLGWRQVVAGAALDAASYRAVVSFSASFSSAKRHDKRRNVLAVRVVPLLLCSP